ncbi:MAG: ComF family protein [Marinifilaceae bacterium]|jgi:ComF family protein|nr:ComF family protein [Marinifilaceae bacterium]
MSTIFKELLSAVLNLFYPRLCINCSKALLESEYYICLHCLYDIPKSNNLPKADNLIEQKFWGLAKIEQAGTMFIYNKGNSIQNLLFALKYRGKSKFGVFLGELLGHEIKKSGRFTNIDYIIPIPLHRKKFKLRGFNQSSMIAKGISNVLNKPLREDIVYRNSNTKTQTSMSREHRWKNVKSVFSLDNNADLNGKHILLVDDVITTGATLCSCSIELTNIGSLVSVVAIASSDI